MFVFLAAAYVSSLVTVSQERSHMDHGLEMWGMAMQWIMVPANCNKEKMTVCMLQKYSGTICIVSEKRLGKKI